MDAQALSALCREHGLVPIRRDSKGVERADVDMRLLEAQHGPVVGLAVSGDMPAEAHPFSVLADEISANGRVFYGDPDVLAAGIS